jgi:hypothetical protein
MTDDIGDYRSGWPGMQEDYAVAIEFIAAFSLSLSCSILHIFPMVVLPKAIVFDRENLVLSKVPGPDKTFTGSSECCSEMRSVTNRNFVCIDSRPDNLR